MSNEFEKQKQEIIELAQSIIMRSGLSKSVLIASIKQLQPPAPPKCSTCKYLKDDGVTNYECEAWDKKGVAISEMASNYISDPDTWGCTSHSQYDKDGEV